MPDDVCPICHRPVGERAITLRYERRRYVFDADMCKRMFQENPDRYLDAGGDVLPEPRG
ncbi:MAG: YHS domain-containing protein [Chloroflexota bacterium]|nr:YHS domain-containing protein [Chloroflexota bacterium]MDE3102409.1 YHS domain-containing protein [Chloroflexota bacterium]